MLQNLAEPGGFDILGGSTSSVTIERHALIYFYRATLPHTCIVLAAF